MTFTLNHFLTVGALWLMICHPSVTQRGLQLLHHLGWSEKTLGTARELAMCWPWPVQAHVNLWPHAIELPKNLECVNIRMISQHSSRRVPPTVNLKSPFEGFSHQLCLLNQKLRCLLSQSLWQNKLSDALNISCCSFLSSTNIWNPAHTCILSTSLSPKAQQSFSPYMVKTTRRAGATGPQKD